MEPATDINSGRAFPDALDGTTDGAGQHRETTGSLG